MHTREELARQRTILRAVRTPATAILILQSCERGSDGVATAKALVGALAPLPPHLTRVVHIMGSPDASGAADENNDDDMATSAHTYGGGGNSSVNRLAVEARRPSSRTIMLVPPCPGVAYRDHCVFPPIGNWVQRHTNLWLILFFTAFCLSNMYVTAFAFYWGGAHWLSSAFTVDFLVIAGVNIGLSVVLASSLNRDMLRDIVCTFEFVLLVALFLVDGLYQSVLFWSDGQQARAVLNLLLEVLASAVIFTVDALAADRRVKGVCMAATTCVLASMVLMFLTQKGGHVTELGPLSFTFWEEQRYISTTIGFFCAKYAFTSLVMKYDTLLLRFAPTMLRPPDPLGQEDETSFLLRTAEITHDLSVAGSHGSSVRHDKSSNSSVHFVISRQHHMAV